ncbi:MAG: hypothetical protein ABJD07_06785 [Gemmatimonadaceae bacterium]
MRVAAIYDIHANLPALEAVAARIRQTSYPQAREFAATGILQPRSERDVLASLATADLP